jgi:hypothetical protein
MKWIKLSEQKPKVKDKAYIVTMYSPTDLKRPHNEFDCEVADWHPESNDFLNPCCHQWAFAKYWMELPSAPKDEDEKL